MSAAASTAERIRLVLQRNAHIDYGDEGRQEGHEEEAVTQHHLYDRHPRLGLEIGDGNVGSESRSFVGSRAATAAAAFAHGLEFKGAVPVLNEYEAMFHEETHNLIPLRDSTSAVPFAASDPYPPVLSETVITCMYVHTEDVNPGLGIVYTSTINIIQGKQLSVCNFQSALTLLLY